MKNKLPKKLEQKLEERKANNSLRQLACPNNLVDFSSNDYLGFSNSETLFNATHQFLVENTITRNGATGSRLLSGNHQVYDKVESLLCEQHHSEAALIFNSGYDANIGFFSSVPQRHDIIFYDEHIHASIRDGMTMSLAKSYKFKHNNLEDLKLKYKQEGHRNGFNGEVYIVTEAVFSMDGDSPDLKAFVEFCSQNESHLIVDEAHALGVFGKNGMGLCQALGIEQQLFARIITFGKALGCHGSAVLATSELKDFLVNFSRPFIYTTGLPPHSLTTILMAYKQLPETSERKQLLHNISFFKTEVQKLQLERIFINSDSPIHCALIPGNAKIKDIANTLQTKGFDVKSILSPTVPKGQERLRFCLHAYNSEKEISEVLNILTTFV